MELIIIYTFYLFISIWITVKVGNSLYVNGRYWIIHLLGDVNLSDKLNNTLLLGYRLVNIGYILFTLMKRKSEMSYPYMVIEFLGVKLGIILSILAYLHFQNIIVIFIFSKLKHKHKWQL